VSHSPAKSYDENQTIISVAIALTVSVTTLKVDKVKANPIAAPACQDIPSCVVTGTVVIGGVVYYVIKNTVTGVVRRVPTGQLPPAHRKVEEGRHKVGDKVYAPGLVSNRADCEQKARDYGRNTDGGEWIVVDCEAVGGGPERIDHHGNVEYMPIKFRCVLQKVK